MYGTLTTSGSGITISGGTGTIGYNSNLGGPSSVSFNNEGTIDADAPGTIALSGFAWTNSGTIEVSGGGTFSASHFGPDEFQRRDADGRHLESDLAGDPIACR